MAIDAPGTPGRRAKVRLLLVLLLVSAVLVGYVVFQPWRRPALYGGDGVSIVNTYVGNTYVCGAVIGQGPGRWPVEVTKMSLSTEDDVEAVLFAASRNSRYDVGAGVYREWPDLDGPEEVTGGFNLVPNDPLGGPYRVNVAIKPRSLGNVGRFTATVTYKYRWLPARSVKVDFTCQLEVTGTGEDPRVE